MKKYILSVIVFILFFIFALNTIYSDSLASDNKELAVHFIDVGQGDCTLITLPDGKNILVDAGSPSSVPIIVKYLKSLGIKQIDHLIFTHPHDDHIGGIFSVLSEFKVSNFYDNGFSNFNSTIYGDYTKKVRGNLTKYNILQAGESLLFNKLRIDVLNPLLPPSGRLNEDSIVLKLHYGDIKILLSGDLGRLGEWRLLNSGTELTSRILKAGHHGDNNASSNDFLQNVKPETAIISVSKINKYAQPRQEVLNRLNKTGAKIYRTDLSGHITLKTNGKTYSVYTEK